MSSVVTGANGVLGSRADAARIWNELRVLVHERYDRRKEVTEALGMSFIRVKALRHLASAGPMPHRRLAAALSTDAPYTTIVIDDLVRRGLAERTVDPADRRVKIVGLTFAGAEAAARAEQILSEPPPSFSRLSPGDLAALDRILTALTSG